MSKNILDKLTKHFSQSVVRTYPKGKVITMANHEPEGVSLLMDGIVEQYDITPEGNKVIVNMFKPPAFFPMSWAINKVPNTYFYAALTDVKLKHANADDTVAFLRANPDVTFDLLSRVYKGTDALLQRLVFAASGKAPNRLMFELLVEAYRFGTKINNTKCLIKIKRNTLAYRSGLARETVSRELHKLEDNKLLSLTKQGIVIDITELESKLGLNI